MLAMACYLVAASAGGNGFIAAFVGGLAFGRGTRHQAEETVRFTEAQGSLLAIGVWCAFGLVLAGKLLASPWGLTPVVYAALSLSVIRMLPVGLALMGQRFQPLTILFIGWFGPRGLASIVFLVLGMTGLEAVGIDAGPLPATVAWTVVLSVILAIDGHAAQQVPGTQHSLALEPGAHGHLLGGRVADHDVGVHAQDGCRRQRPLGHGPQRPRPDAAAPRFSLPPSNRGWPDAPPARHATRHRAAHPSAASTMANAAPLPSLHITSDSSTKARASADSYGCGMETHREISGSWHATTRAGISLSRHGRRTMSPRSRIVASAPVSWWPMAAGLAAALTVGQSSERRSVDSPAARTPGRRAACLASGRQGRASAWRSG